MSGGGNTVGQIGGQASSDALNLGGLSIDAMVNRYKQLGLGGVGATPAGGASGAVAGVPGSGTTPVNPGQFATGSTTVSNPAQGAPQGTINPLGSQVGGGGISVPTGGPTAMEMDIGAAPSWTGGIPQMFAGALGEAQFQDLGQTASAAAGSANAKAQGISGIGQLVGAI